MATLGIPIPKLNDQAPTPLEVSTGSLVRKHPKKVGKSLFYYNEPEAVWSYLVLLTSSLSLLLVASPVLKKNYSSKQVGNLELDPPVKCLSSELLSQI